MCHRADPAGLSARSRSTSAPLDEQALADAGDAGVPGRRGRRGGESAATRWGGALLRAAPTAGRHVEVGRQDGKPERHERRMDRREERHRDAKAKHPSARREHRQARSSTNLVAQHARRSGSRPLVVAMVATDAQSRATRLERDHPLSRKRRYTRVLSSGSGCGRGSAEADRRAQTRAGAVQRAPMAA